jgi:hypothetical protein
MADDEPSIVPAVPPFPGVAIPPENRAPGTPTTLAAATPPPLSNIPLQQQGSGVSSLKNALTGASASTHDDRDIDPTPKKGKRQFPDFSRPTSLDNPDLSGDDSDGWIEEEVAINERISADNAAERELADNTMDDPLEEIQEFEYLLEGLEGAETAPNAGGNEGEQGEQRGEGGNVGVGRFDLITVRVKTHTLAELKKICKALDLSITGTKPVLFKRLRDSGREAIERINDDTLRYRQPVADEAPDLTLPRWVILNPDPVDDIEGIDMLRGAQHGFFGPTNIENAVGAPKWQYLCREEEKIRRPQFASKNNPARPISEMGHMSDYARDSMTEDSIWWVLKKRKVWSGIHQQIKEVGFLRLNMIDEYNSYMNSVDVADQLRNQYRPDHWMRNRKWWWAFLIWGLGVATTNAYKMYCSMYDEEKA